MRLFLFYFPVFDWINSCFVSTISRKLLTLCIILYPVTLVIMGDNEESARVSDDAMSRQEAMGKFEELDKSVKKIFDLLSGLTKQQEQGASSPPTLTSSATSGAGASGASQPPPKKPVHPATAPADIQVSQQAKATTLPAQSSSQLFSALSGGASSAAGVDQPGASLPATPTGPAVSVSPALQPVPGYLVDKIKEGKFVDFNLLRPYNLKKLPVAEPNQLQLTKLFRTEFRKIQNFVDWVEAWAVYAGIIAKESPEKVASLISYFLLLSSAQRDVPGSGWLDYDVAFRKYVVDNPSSNWGEVIPTLWMTTVLTRGSQPQESKEGNLQHQPKSNLPCFKWNAGECTYARCRFQHNMCSVCRGPHKRLDCNQRPQDASLPVSQQESSKSQPQHDSAQASRKRAYQK